MTRPPRGQGYGHWRLAHGEIAEVHSQDLAKVPSNARRILVPIPDHSGAGSPARQRTFGAEDFPRT